MRIRKATEADHLKALDVYKGLEEYHDPYMSLLNRLSLKRVFQRLAISHNSLGLQTWL